MNKLVYEVNTSKNISAVNAKAIHKAVLSPDRKTILTYYAGSREISTIRAYEAVTGKWLYDIKNEDEHSINNFFFSVDGSLVYSKNFGDTVYKKWNTGNGFYQGNIDEIPFVISNDATAEIQRSAILIRDRITKNLVKKLQHKETEISELLLSPDSSFFISVSGFYKNHICVWNAKTLQLISESEVPVSINHQFFSFTPDGKNLLIASANVNSMLLWDISKRKVKCYLNGHSGGISDFVFLPGKHQLLTTSSEIILWDINTGKNLSKIIPLNDADYLNIISAGYYKGTKTGASSLHYISSDLKVISFEQLDVKYNRPDKVLEAIGNKDTVLINSYKRAYYKRIKKLGIDTTQFNDGYSVPETDFENRDAVQFEQSNEQIRFRIKASDSSYLLDRFNIWINEVPLFGMKGISIRHLNSHAFDTTISIKLSQGENRIETSVSNVNGTESYRMPLYVKYTATQPVKEMVHFIGIGINEFADSRRNLQWCVKDIRDQALMLKEKYGSNIIIDTLFNQNVTLSNIQALKQKLLQTNINDKVIIAYSGHGLLSKQYDYYLSSYTVNFKNPEINGIAYEEIENLLDRIPARKKLLMIDACHSGEVDKDELMAIQNNKNKGNKG
jgi:Caspase domain